MKKIAFGFVVGVCISIAIQSFAWDRSTTVLCSVNDLGTLVEKQYAKQKSIDERLANIEKILKEK